LAAVAERTRRISLGTGVTAPIFRYNPAIVAQAFATLGNLYPGRVFLGLGTGEAMNEVPLGFEWPKTSERIDRLEEAIKVIKLLWEKEFVSMKGKYYSLRKANLYTKPVKPVPIYVAANGPKTATLAGKYADGIVTITFPPDHYLNTIFPALQNGARLAGRDPSRIYKIIETVCAYGKDYDTAMQACRKWGATAIPSFFQMNIHDPREIEALGKLVDPGELAKTWLISADPDDHIKMVESYIKLGFQGVHVANAATEPANEESFIMMYGKHVIPYVKDTYARS
jgi:coenzyme F420-dependent glucose-6-phosphate dehydrogenase